MWKRWRQGLADGTMDVISTDHAPHSEEEKNRSMAKAAFGIVGLETSAALTYTELVKTGILSVMQMAEKMSYNPAQILGLSDKGAVAEGKKADLVIFDPNPNPTPLIRIRLYPKGRILRSTGEP